MHVGQTFVVWDAIDLETLQRVNVWEAKFHPSEIMKKQNITKFSQISVDWVKRENEKILKIFDQKDLTKKIESTTGKKRKKIVL